MNVPMALKSENTILILYKTDFVNYVNFYQLATHNNDSFISFNEKCR